MGAAAEVAEALEVEAICTLVCMLAFIWQIAAICTRKEGQVFERMHIYQSLSKPMLCNASKKALIT